MRALPAIVVQLVNMHDAWIVGSAANPDSKEIRDFDILVPFSEWRYAAILISYYPDARPNTFGGWKLTSEGTEVDVWPDDLGICLTNHLFEYAWHPRSGTRIKAIR